ncbi:hypothetical protein ACH3XW_32430 [Acanthocheilonema viteae]
MRISPGGIPDICNMALIDELLEEAEKAVSDLYWIYCWLDNRICIHKGKQNSSRCYWVLFDFAPGFFIFLVDIFLLGSY